MQHRISICIPAYNRARFLPALLDSIVKQKDTSLEVVICEDKSPEREEIRTVVDRFRSQLDIAYIENPENLGYDANLRACIGHASGAHCLIMGNDDILCDSAVSEIRKVIEAYPSVGIISRAYSIFSGDPSNIRESIVHFASSRFFPRGPESFVTLYRRVGVISGITFRKDLATSLATDRWDGTLYYQMYLCGEIILAADGFYLAKTLVSCRDGIAPDFGNSKRERQFYKPGRYTNDARLKMFGAQLHIARDIEHRHGIKVFDSVVRDLGDYSYFMLSPQRREGVTEFMRYYWQLGGLGFARRPLYHCYFIALLLLGNRGAEFLVRSTRRLLAATPRFGNLYAGHPAKQL
jgi:abequosyltransferase